MARSGPPAYAWDWFGRQRLLWREVRSRLVVASEPAAIRYASVDSRADVLALLRADYLRDEVVRSTVDAVVTEVAFLGRTQRTFDELGFVNPPRGLRWWWSALTGEDLDSHTAARAGTPADGHAATQLRLDASGPDADTERRGLDDVHEGYGG